MYNNNTFFYFKIKSRAFPISRYARENPEYKIEIPFLIKLGSLLVNPLNRAAPMENWQQSIQVQNSYVMHDARRNERDGTKTNKSSLHRNTFFDPSPRHSNKVNRRKARYLVT